MGLLIFLFNYFLRSLFISIFLSPYSYLQYLPRENFIRADKLLSGKLIVNPDIWSSFYILLSIFFRFIDFIGVKINRIPSLIQLNIILASLSIYLIYRLSKRMFSYKIALIISILFSFYYPYIYMNSLVMSENFFIPALIGFLYLLTYPLKQSKINSVLAGILLGIALLCRPILFSFIPFIIIWLWFYNKKLFVLFIPVVIIVIISGIINFKVSTQHYFSLGTNGGFNFALTQCQIKKLNYNGPNNENFNFKPPVYWKSDKAIINTSVPFSNQTYYYQMGFSCLIKNPTRIFSNFNNIKNIFSSILYPNFPKHPVHNSLIFIWKYIMMLFMILFILFPFTCTDKKIKKIFWLFSGLIMSLFISVYFYNPGEERYLISYSFILIFFAVPTICNLWKYIYLHKGIHRMKSIIN